MFLCIFLGANKLNPKINFHNFSRQNSFGTFVNYHLSTIILVKFTWLWLWLWLLGSGNAWFFTKFSNVDSKNPAP
jgi:hypothetical protein